MRSETDVVKVLIDDGLDSIELLNFNPSTNVDVGIKNLIKWYKEFYQC